MADKKELAPIEVSPVGRLAYAYLYTKDDKYAKTPEDAKHTATLVIPKDTDAGKWAAAIGKQHVAAGGKKNEGPCVDADVKYEGNKDKLDDFGGCYLVVFKTYKTPGLVDAAKQLLPAGLKIQSGDQVKVAFSRNEYQNGSTKGLSLRMAAVQLIDKRAGAGVAKAGIAAFDEEEDGFVADADADYGGDTAADDGSDNDGDY